MESLIRIAPPSAGGLGELDAESATYSKPKGLESLSVRLCHRTFSPME